MKPLKYYHLLENDKINIKWKTFHILFFIGIIFNSILGARYFCMIFDTFNYRCILYAKVATKFIDIVYKNESSLKAIQSSTMISKDSETDILQNFQLRVVPDRKLNLGIFESDYIEEMGKRNLTGNSEAQPVPGVPDIYIVDDEIWLINETMTARAIILMTTTVFATSMMCNYVILIPFFSLIISSFFITMFLFLSTTQMSKKNQNPVSWLFVYPLMGTCSTMTILSFVANNLVVSGLNAFCFRFLQLTGKKECSIYMDYFTKQQKLGRRPLYRNIRMCKISFLLLSLLWLAQLLTVLFRIICAPDFYYAKIYIKKKDYLDDEEIGDDLYDLEEFEYDASSQRQLMDVIREVKKMRTRRTQRSI